MTDCVQYEKDYVINTQTVHSVPKAWKGPPLSQARLKRYNPRGISEDSDSSEIFSTGATSFCGLALYMSVSVFMGLRLSLCACICLCVCIFISLSVYMSLYLSLCLCLWVFLPVCLYVFVSVFVNVSVSLHISLSLSDSVCVHQAGRWLNTLVLFAPYFL